MGDKQENEEDYWLSYTSGLSGNWGKTAFRLIEIIRMYFSHIIKNVSVEEIETERRWRQEERR